MQKKITVICMIIILSLILFVNSAYAKNDEINWHIGKTKLIGHSKYTSYYVSYEEADLNGNISKLYTNVRYVDGKWKTSLPGMEYSDFEEECKAIELKKYTNENLDEKGSKISNELAYGILNKYLNEDYDNPDRDWYIGNVDLIGYLDENEYLVEYTDKNIDGSSGEILAIIRYEDGEWKTNLPGFTFLEDEDQARLTRYTDEDLEAKESTISTELAYGVLNEKLNDEEEDWYIKEVKIIGYAEITNYLVEYEEIDENGNKSTLYTNLRYVNGEWKTFLPGFSGFEEDMDENNLVRYTTEDLKEKDSGFSTELAYGVLNKYLYENSNLNDANWYIGEVQLIGYINSNTYLVSHEEVNLDGYTSVVYAYIKYDNGEWKTSLPGFSGFEDEDLEKLKNFSNNNIKSKDSTISSELAYGILNKNRNDNFTDKFKTSHPSDNIDDFYIDVSRFEQVNVIDEDKTDGKKEDKTIAKDPIPQTGIKEMGTIILVVFLIAGISIYDIYKNKIK